MSTVLPHEPMTGDGLVPHMSTLADRLYSRLPEVYRHQDGLDSTWSFKRYLSGLLVTAGEVSDVVELIRGDRPIGPPTPEPWALAPDELAVWRAGRQTRASALGDPDQARAEWLPWLAQLVGARLDPGASEAEHRDTIRYATSGWRGGTRSAIADAARTALTGTKYARVVPHTVPSGAGGIEPGTVWDITVVTRVSETPDAGAVLGAILRKGVKPAGVVLSHAVYEATFDQQEAVYPTWAERDAATWDELAEAGLVYRAVPNNLLPNPSFEVDATGWSGRGAISTVGRVAGGLDGLGMGRLSVSAAGTGELLSPFADVTAETAYIAGLSLRTTTGRTVACSVDWYDATDTWISYSEIPGAAIGDDAWQRVQGEVTSPAGAVKAQLYVHIADMALGEWYDLDAAIVRSAA